MLPKVVFRPEFAQDHESGLRSYRGPEVLCDFSMLRLRKSPYDFLNLYGRFCPYNPPYNPGHDTLPSNLHIEIFTQRKKTRRKSIGFLKLMSKRTVLNLVGSTSRYSSTWLSLTHSNMLTCYRSKKRIRKLPVESLRVLPV